MKDDCLPFSRRRVHVWHIGAQEELFATVASVATVHSNLAFVKVCKLYRVLCLELIMQSDDEMTEVAV